MQQENEKFGAIRLSRQRQIILNEVLFSKSHPTADMVYKNVQEALPRISLGTVYRNLESLSEAGYILRIDTGKGPRRYDGTPHSHAHIRCIRCDSLEDLPEFTALEKVLKEDIQTPYEIHDIIVEVRGICPGCASNDGPLTP